MHSSFRDSNGVKNDEAGSIVLNPSLSSPSSWVSCSALLTRTCTKADPSFPMSMLETLTGSEICKTLCILWLNCRLVHIMLVGTPPPYFSCSFRCITSVSSEILPEACNMTESLCSPTSRLRHFRYEESSLVNLLIKIVTYF